MKTEKSAAKEFLEAVNHYCKGLVVAPGTASCCPDCVSELGFSSEEEMEEAEETGEAIDEGGFSWSQCDSCGSRLGGNRYTAHGLSTNQDSKEIYHLSICDDCLCFHANGDLPEIWE